VPFEGPDGVTAARVPDRVEVPDGRSIFPNVDTLPGNALSKRVLVSEQESDGSCLKLRRALILTESRKRARLRRMDDGEDFGQMLRGAALRVTRPRLAVLDAVNAHPHLDTESIIVAVHEFSPEVSRQAVYNSLHTLADAGLVRRIQPAGSVARYESRTGDNHHHMVCRSCAVITDVDCAVGEAPCLTASDDNGFTIDEAEVTYWGLCPACSAVEVVQNAR